MTIATNRRAQGQLHDDSHAGWLGVCATAALSYLLPKLIGLVVSNPQTVWPLWPGCAILVTGLLFVRLRFWPVLIAASYAGFALADVQAGVPLSSIAWFIPGNTAEVLISALGLRFCFNGVPRLNSLKALAKYSAFAVVLGPLAGAFFSANGIARDYWTGWNVVFLSEVLAFVTLTPALLSWANEGRVLMRKSRVLQFEGAMLIAGLGLVSYIVFTAPENNSSPALFYSLVPFLLWSALRFGWLGVSNSLVVVTFLSIWGAVHGRGPFSHLVPLTHPLPLQVFLIFVAMPFMVLAALAEEHEQTTHVVRESEERFRLLANTAPVMIWTAGTDRLCTYVNQPWLEFTGRPLESELGNGWVQAVHDEDRNRCLEIYLRAFDQRQPFEMEYRLRRNDGEYRWILDTGVPRFNADGSFAGYIGSGLDITDRKLAEEALASIGRRLIEAQEKERTWIARELHDDISQRLALLAVELERWNRDVPESALEIRNHIAHTRLRVSEIAGDTQSLSHRLHSSKLEYLGIATAIRSFCRELSEQQKVQVEFQHTDVPPRLSAEISLALFRVVQEALLNAVKHSQVRELKVELQAHERELHLTISDSGRGFDTTEAMNGRGLGLISMRERLRLVNGELSIQSEPGRGTTIIARVPIGQKDQSVAIAG